VVGVDLREQPVDDLRVGDRETRGRAAGSQRGLAALPVVGDPRQLVERGRRAGRILDADREQQHAQPLAQHALAARHVDHARIAFLAIERALNHGLARDQQPRDHR